MYINKLIIILYLMFFPIFELILSEIKIINFIFIQQLVINLADDF